MNVSDEDNNKRICLGHRGYRSIAYLFLFSMLIGWLYFLYSMAIAGTKNLRGIYVNINGYDFPAYHTIFSISCIIYFIIYLYPLFHMIFTTKKYLLTKDNEFLYFKDKKLVELYNIYKWKLYVKKNFFKNHYLYLEIVPRKGNIIEIIVSFKENHKELEKILEKYLSPPYEPFVL